MTTLESRRDNDLSLSEFLSDRARHSSDARLALDAGIGFVVAVAATLWRGPGWFLLTAAGLCFLAYGGWGIADRELQERRAASSPGVRWLKVARALTVAVGTASAIAFAIAILGVAIGTVKS